MALTAVRVNSNKGKLLPVRAMKAYMKNIIVMNLNFGKNFLKKLRTKPGRLASLSLMTQ